MPEPRYLYDELGNVIPFDPKDQHGEPCPPTPAIGARGPTGSVAGAGTPLGAWLRRCVSGGQEPCSRPRLCGGGGGLRRHPALYALACAQARTATTSANRPAPATSAAPAAPAARTAMKVTPGAIHGPLQHGRPSSGCSHGCPPSPRRLSGSTRRISGGLSGRSAGNGGLCGSARFTLNRSHPSRSILPHPEMDSTHPELEACGGRPSVGGVARHRTPVYRMFHPLHRPRLQGRRQPLRCRGLLLHRRHKPGQPWRAHPRVHLCQRHRQRRDGSQRHQLQRHRTVRIHPEQPVDTITRSKAR